MQVFPLKVSPSMEYHVICYLYLICHITYMLLHHSLCHMLSHVICSKLHVMSFMSFSVPSGVDQVNRPVTGISYTEVTISVAELWQK